MVTSRSVTSDKFASFLLSTVQKCSGAVEDVSVFFFRCVVCLFVGLSVKVELFSLFFFLEGRRKVGIVTFAAGASSSFSSSSSSSRK